MKKTRICTKCNIEKKFEEFHDDKYNNDGKTTQCKDCRMKYDREYKKRPEAKEKNRERSKQPKRKEYEKRYREENRDKVNGYVRDYRERIKEREKISPLKKICSQCKIEKNIEYFAKDKYSISGYTVQCKKCRNEGTKIYMSKEENLVKIRKRENERMRKNVELRINRNISKEISLSIKKNFLSKWKFLPYDINRLKEHLENQFDENMNWDNHGSYWHIDHIIPRNCFNFKHMEEENFIRCWSLKNLRPLEAKENLKKGNRILEEFKSLYDELVVEKKEIN